MQKKNLFRSVSSIILFFMYPRLYWPSILHTRKIRAENDATFAAELNSDFIARFILVRFVINTKRNQIYNLGKIVG